MSERGRGSEKCQKCHVALNGPLRGLLDGTILTLTCGSSGSQLYPLVKKDTFFGSKTHLL